jgi:hypothetical protein
MHRSTTRRGVSCIAGAICASAVTAPAVDAQALPESIAVCAREADAGRRLACYDHAVAAFGSPAAEPQVAGSVTPQSVPPAPVAAAAAAALTPEEKFGLDGKLEEQVRAPAETGTPDLAELPGTVVKISTDARGKLTVTLTNGQVWVQKHAGGYFPLAVDDAVTIRTRSFGSYAMYNPTGRFTQVVRVK